MKRINPAELAPPQGNAYAHAVVVEPGLRPVFISGQVASNAQGELIGPGDHAKQAEQCFRNLKTAMDAAGASAQDVAQMTIYIVDHAPERLGGIIQAGYAAFGGDWPVAASVLVGVAALVEPGFLVETSAVAYIRA